MNEIFNYKHQVIQHREYLWQRLAAYVGAHPEETFPQISRKFHTNVHTLWEACLQNGMKRKVGRPKRAK
jgi:hypothetical protein